MLGCVLIILKRGGLVVVEARDVVCIREKKGSVCLIAHVMRVTLPSAHCENRQLAVFVCVIVVCKDGKVIYWTNPQVHGRG